MTDKTDYCTSNYLEGKTTKQRNKRRNIDGTLTFPKMEKRRDTRWKANGSGVVHSVTKKEMERRAEYARARRAQYYCTLTFDTNVGESRLIKSEARAS